MRIFALLLLGCLAMVDASAQTPPGGANASIREGPEFNRHAGEFSRCLGLSIITVSGKPFNEVDKCLSQASDPKKGK